MLKPGEVLLLLKICAFTNRKKKGDEGFAEKNYQKLGDVYQRCFWHSAPGPMPPLAVIAKYFDADHKMFGLLMEGEVSSAEKYYTKQKTFYRDHWRRQGFRQKILIIENLLERATDIIIGGGMAYTL